MQSVSYHGTLLLLTSIVQYCNTSNTATQTILQHCNTSNTATQATLQNKQHCNTSITGTNAKNLALDKYCAIHQHRIIHSSNASKFCNIVKAVLPCYTTPQDSPKLGSYIIALPIYMSPVLGCLVALRNTATQSF